MMRFSQSKILEFEIDNQVQPNIQRLKLQNPSDLNELISISENFLTEIRDNIATNDCYNRMLLNYIIGFYDKFYASTIEKIHESFLQNKPVTEYLDALELLIKYEYQFAVELKGERIVENLSSLIDLIPYLYDRESILNLLITIADKLTDEEYENESYGWIRKLYSFGIPIFDFLDENNFIHIRDLKFIIDIYSDKLLRSIKNKIRAVQYFIGRDIIDEEDELDSEQLLLIKKILTIKRGLIPDNLATEMMVDLTLLTALQRDSLEQNSGCLRLFCATGCIYEAFVKVKIKDHFMLLPRYEIPWEKIARNFLNCNSPSENVIKSLLIILKGIEKSNCNRTQSIRAHYFFYKSEGNHEWGLQLMQFLMKTADISTQIPSLLGKQKNILIELFILFIIQAEILTSYHLKVEYRNPDEERHYKENYTASILKFFYELENLMLSQEIIYMPKALQEAIYGLYFNIATSDLECVKVSRLSDILAYDQFMIMKVLQREIKTDFIALEKLRAPFWWERYAVPYRDKMNELANNIIESDLFKNLPIYLQNPDYQEVLITKPEILIGMILLYVEVIKRRSSIFTQAYSDTLNLVLELVTKMQKINARQSEDILSVLINFSYDDQIDKIINLEKKIKAYLHSLAIIAPHNWSNRIQIRFLFWGFQNDSKKAKYANTLMLEATEVYYKKFKETEAKLLSNQPELSSQQEVDNFIFDIGSSCFEFLMGIYGIFFVYMRDLSDSIMKFLSKDLEKIIDKMSEIGVSPLILFMPNEFCSRYQYYNFGDAFKSSEEKKAPLFKAFWNHFESLLAKVLEPKGFAFKLSNIKYIIENVQFWTPEKGSWHFFSKMKFSPQDYQILLVVHLLIRIRKLFFFWNSQLFKKECEPELYKKIESLTPSIIKFVLRFQYCIYKALIDDHTSNQMNSLLQDWRAFFDVVWEGVIFINRLFGIASKDLVKQAYSCFILEIIKAINSKAVPYNVKLILCQSFKYKKISENTELSKKLGIYNIEEFFQNILYDNAGMDAMNNILKSIAVNPSATYSFFESEFLGGMLDFYSNLEPSSESTYENCFLNVLEKLKEPLEPRIKELVVKINYAIIKQLESKETRIMNINKEIHEIRYRKKRCLIKKSEIVEMKSNEEVLNQIEKDVKYLEEVEASLMARNSKLIASLKETSDRFLKINENNIFEVFNMQDKITVFPAEKLYEHGLNLLKNKNESYKSFLENFEEFYKANSNDEDSSQMYGPSLLIRLTKFHDRLKDYDWTAKSVMNFFSKVFYSNNQFSCELGKTWKSYHSWWDDNLIEMVFSLQLKLLHELKRETNFHTETGKFCLENTIKTANTVVGTIMTSIYYRLYYNEITSEDLQKFIDNFEELILHISQIRNSLTEKTPTKGQLQELMFQISQFLFGLNEEMALTTIKNLDIQSLFAESHLSESPKFKGFLYTLLKRGINQDLQIEIHLKKIAQNTLRINISDLEKQLVTFSKEDLFFILQQNNIFETLDSKRDSIDLTELQFITIADHKYIQQNLSSASKFFFNLYLDSFVENYKRIYNEVFSPKKTKDVNDLHHENWIDLVCLLKEFPYLVPYICFRKMSITLSKKIHLQNGARTETIIEFMMKEPFFIDNVSIWYFYKELLTLSATFNVTSEGKRKGLNDIIVSKILISIKEIIDTELQRLSVFEDSTLLERLISMCFIFRKLKEEIKTEELWDFYETLTRKLLKLVRISLRKNFKCYRAILNSTLWSEMIQILKELNEIRAIKRSEKDQYYLEIIKEEKRQSRKIEDFLNYETLFTEHTFEEETGMISDFETPKSSSKTESLKLFSGYRCLPSTSIEKDDEVIEKTREKIKIVKKYYIDSGIEPLSYHFHDLKQKRFSEIFGFKSEIENLVDDLGCRENCGSLRDFISKKLGKLPPTQHKIEEKDPTKFEDELASALLITPMAASIEDLELKEIVTEKKFEKIIDLPPVDKSSRYRFFTRASIKSRDDFDQAINHHKNRMKTCFEGSLVEFQSATLFEQKKFDLKNFEKVYDFTDEFSRSCMVLFFKENLSDFLSEDLRELADMVHREYQDINSNFSDYLKALNENNEPRFSNYDNQTLDSILVNPPGMMESEKAELLSGSVPKKGNKLFDLLSKVTFYQEDPNKIKQPFSKRKCVTIKKPAKKPIDADTKSKINNFITLNESEIMELIIPFFHDYKEGWPADNFNDMVKELLLDPINEIRLFDALLLFAYVPNALTDPAVQDILSSAEIKINPKVYTFLLDNIMIFFNDYFETNKPSFFSLPLSIIEEKALHFINELKSKYEFHKNFKNATKGVDLILGLINIPVIQQNCLKSFSFIKFFEKLTVMEAPSSKLQSKNWISGKNIISLFSLIRVHFENHHTIKDEIYRVFQSFNDHPENFPGIVSSLIHILELEVNQTISFMKESVQSVRYKVKNNMKLDDFEISSYFHPSFVIIETVLKILSTFFLRSMFEASFSQKSTNKKPISRELMITLEESLLNLLENLKAQSVTDYMLDIYHLLELIYKKESGIQSNMIFELVSIGVSYSLLYIAEENIGEKISSLLEDDDFPHLVQVISQDNDFSDLPNLENIGSFTKIREKAELDFNLIFSNFGLKYSSQISKLAKEPNGTMREEIWHLNHKFPWIFEYSTKKDIFKKIFREFIPDPEAREKLVIDRENAVRDFLRQCSVTKKNDLLKTLSVTFQGEAGIDDGGLRREFYKLISDQLFNPDFGLFQLSANGQSIEPTAGARMIPYHLKLLEFSGIVIAKAIIDDINIGVTFTKYFLKHILGRNLSLADLEDVDPDLANGLQFVLENDVEDLGLTFTYERKVLDESYLTELVPGGLDISVTNANKKEYVKKFCQAKMVHEHEAEIQAFVKGFRSLLPAAYISYFSPTELGLMIAGIQNINLEDLKTNCIYLNCNQETTVIQWFWEILEDFSIEELSSFLFFISGATKLPYGGGKLIPLKLKKSNLSPNSLPVAHTCYFEIEIPEYPSKEVFREKLLLGIYEGKEGFHIV